MSIMKTEIEKGKELHLLANNYLYGSDIIERDCKKARKMYLEAINLGDIESYAQLGVIYINGEGVEENKAKGFDYLTIGVSLGVVNCHAELAIGYYNNENSIEAVASWSDYFNLVGDDNYSAFYFYTYLQMVSKEEDIKLRYQTKLSYMKTELIDLVEDLISDSTAEDLATNEDYKVLSIINNQLEDTLDAAEIYQNFLILKYGTENSEPNYEKALYHFNKHFADDLNPTDYTLYFYYRNEEKPKVKYLSFLEQGIEKGDYNCIGAKASNMFDSEDYLDALKLWDLYFYRAMGNINTVFSLEYINYISTYGFKAKHLQALKDIKQSLVTSLKGYEGGNAKEDIFVKTSIEFIEKELSGKSWYQKIFL